MAIDNNATLCLQSQQLTSNSGGSMGNHSAHQGCVRLQSEDAKAELAAGLAIMHPPAFNRAEPEQWFIDVEEHFEALHIWSDAAKCELLIDEIDLDILQLIYVNLEWRDQPYESLKGIILHAILANGLWGKEGNRRGEEWRRKEVPQGQLRGKGVCTGFSIVHLASPCCHSPQRLSLTYYHSLSLSLPLTLCLCSFVFKNTQRNILRNARARAYKSSRAFFAVWKDWITQNYPVKLRLLEIKIEIIINK